MGKNLPCSFLCCPLSPFIPSHTQWPGGQGRPRPVAWGQGCTDLGVDARAVAGGNLSGSSYELSMRNSWSLWEPRSPALGAEAQPAGISSLLPQVFLGEMFIAHLRAEDTLISALRGGQHFQMQRRQEDASVGDYYHFPSLTLLGDIAQGPVSSPLTLSPALSQKVQRP